MDEKRLLYMRSAQGYDLGQSSYFDYTGCFCSIQLRHPAGYKASCDCTGDAPRRDRIENTLLKLTWLFALLELH